MLKAGIKLHTVNDPEVQVPVFSVLYRSFYCLAAVVAEILMSEGMWVAAMPTTTTD